MLKRFKNTSTVDNMFGDNVWPRPHETQQFDVQKQHVVLPLFTCLQVGSETHFELYILPPVSVSEACLQTK